MQLVFADGNVTVVWVGSFLVVEDGKWTVV